MKFNPARGFKFGKVFSEWSALAFKYALFGLFAITSISYWTTNAIYHPDPLLEVSVYQIKLLQAAISGFLISSVFFWFCNFLEKYFTKKEMDKLEKIIKKK